MEWSKWYVVEISYFIGNPKHRAIGRCILEDPQIIEIVSNGEFEKVVVSKLPYFEVICEIEEMNYSRRG